jgi:predicted amidohydrolase
MMKLRVSLISDTFFSRDAASRLRDRLVEAKAQGAVLAILPEIPLNPWSPATRVARSEDEEMLGGTRYNLLSKLSAEVGIHLIGGAIVRSSDGDTSRRHNTSLVFDDNGKLRGSYRKLHLPDEPGFYEGAHYEAGNEPARVIDSALPLGVQTCSDINRPQGSHLLGALGAELIVCPRANEASCYSSWVPVFRANARCSSAYVVSVNRPCPEQGVELGGPSIAVDPWGNIVAESSDPVVTFDLDRSLVMEARETYPGYLPVRSDVYAQGWAAATAVPEEKQQHCYSKILQLLSAEKTNQMSVRDVFQIGYNMGRLQEIRQEGRSEWWDKFKVDVENRDWDSIQRTMQARADQQTGSTGM